ncbi:hypothetical protein [Marinobacter sp. SS21]|uniref:hypothetical protein n=1 Tax=Marinobacter sp. SS21 TaxID=2979460 RepID=UPI002330F86B|nr:hypothetical protein [Marinobacter sp. SS21]MDC0662870.1 hypothetical protein [Marinobacter sp. SS21]
MEAEEPTYVAFFGVMGATSAMVFSALDAEGGTTKTLSETQMPTVYADAGYKGESGILNEGEFSLESEVLKGISSVKIPDGWKVTLYTAPGFQGEALTLTSDTDYVGDSFNDRTASLKVQRT